MFSCSFLFDFLLLLYICIWIFAWILAYLMFRHDTLFFFFSLLFFLLFWTCHSTFFVTVQLLVNIPLYACNVVIEHSLSLTLIIVNSEIWFLGIMGQSHNLF